jgi:quercetin dioxygenase-like cupin family protein
MFLGRALRAMTHRSLARLLLVLAGIPIPAAVSHAQAAAGSPTRVVTPLAGDRRVAGLFAERIRFLPGDRGRPHTHSGNLHVTIVRGRIFLNWGTRFDTTGARLLSAGDFVVLPAGRAHFEWVDEPAEIHVQGIGPVSTAYVDTLAKDVR